MNITEFSGTSSTVNNNYSSTGGHNWKFYASRWSDKKFRFSLKKIKCFFLKSLKFRFPIYLKKFVCVIFIFEIEYHDFVWFFQHYAPKMPTININLLISSNVWRWNNRRSATIMVCGRRWTPLHSKIISKTRCQREQYDPNQFDAIASGLLWRALWNC